MVLSQLKLKLRIYAQPLTSSQAPKVHCLEHLSELRSQPGPVWPGTRFPGVASSAGAQLEVTGDSDCSHCVTLGCDSEISSRPPAVAWSTGTAALSASS